MGVADYLLMDGYGLIVNNDELVVNLELICRGMSFYGCILTSGLIVLGGILLHKKRDKNVRIL